MLYTKLLVSIKWIKISKLSCLFELQCQFDCSHGNTKLLILAHLICDFVSFSLTWSSPATCNHFKFGIILKRNISALQWYIPYTNRVLNNNKYTGLKKVSLLFVSSSDMFFALSWSSKLRENNGEKNTLIVTRSCVLSNTWFRDLKIYFWGLEIIF